MRTLTEIIQTVSCNGMREMTEERISQVMIEYDNEQWVSVEESLPESCPGAAEEVTVNYIHALTGENCSLSAAFHMGKFYVLACWSEDGTDADEIQATHWRLLPKKLDL